MKKNYIKIAWAICVLLLLFACRVEDYSQTETNEYESKSLWKEDEKYIKNIIKIYQENELEIQKGSGKPLWDHAMTMGSFDEDYLIVPVVKGREVVSLLQVPRRDDRVFFLYSQDAEAIRFFQGLIDSRAKKVEISTVPQTSARFVCTTRTVSMWYPDNESNPNGPGHWGTTSVTTCTSAPEDNCMVVVNESCGGDIGGASTGYGYPPIGGGTPNTDPCSKTNTLMASTDVKNVVQDLKNHITSGTGGEKGWKFNKAGGTSETTHNSGHSVNFGNPSLINGGYHNHTTTGARTFSATDISTLIEIARYNGANNPTNAFMGVIIPGDMHYVIRFDGSQSNLPPFGSYSQQQIKQWNKEQWNKFVETIGSIPMDKLVEALFFDTLAKMGLENKVVLQKVENNNVFTINKNPDGSTTPIPCN